MLFFYLKIVYIWIRKLGEYTMKNMFNRLKEKQNKKGFMSFSSPLIDKRGTLFDFTF